MIEDDVSENNDMRQKLSTMTFEELQKLKAEIGSKIYNEAMFGTRESNNKTIKVFKRENKNRPREVSSRKQEPIAIPKAKMPISKARDPRFDNLSGEYNDIYFRKNYSFLNDIRKNEKTELRNQLKVETNPDERRKIKSVLQRMKNKEIAESKKDMKAKKKEEERAAKIQSLEEGKKPYFRSKLEKKVVGLVEQYTDLKKSGKLQKHIEKHSMRKQQQDRKSGFFDDNTLMS